MTSPIKVEAARLAHPANFERRLTTTLEEGMSKTRTVNKHWPLALHETIADIEKRTRNCLEGCLTGNPWLDGIFLDQTKVIEIMRAGALESFRARARFYVSQPGFCREWLEEAVNETVQAIVGLAPLGFRFSGRYMEASPAIETELEAQLQEIVDRDWLFGSIRAVEHDAVPASDGASDSAPDDAGSISKKRGRPAKIPLEAKQQGLAAKKRGAPGREVARLVYRTRYPTERQVKDAPIVLSNYERSVERTKKC